VPVREQLNGARKTYRHGRDGAYRRPCSRVIRDTVVSSRRDREWITRRRERQKRIDGRSFCTPRRWRERSELRAFRIGDDAPPVRARRI